MRHQVEQQSIRPDDRFAVWQGHLLRAKTGGSADAGPGVLLLAASADEAPGGFDSVHEGLPAREVPVAELTHLFELRTHCLHDDEVFALAGSGADGLVLRWTGRDPAAAAELGLVPDGAGWVTTAAPERVEALWQERHDLVATGPVADTGGPPDTESAVRRIGRGLRQLRPPGGAGIAARFRQVGGYAELETRAVVGDVSLSLSAPPELGQAFVELRAAMYEQAKGSWFEGTFTLAEDNRFDFAYDTTAQPRWRRAPGAPGSQSGRAFADELHSYPRDRDLVPPWLAARAGLPLGVEFRHARVADVHAPGERPVVHRPPVPSHEVPGVLAYLYRAPVVLVGETPQPDLFAPGGPADVPHAFHTDGTWIWPAAVPHYLRRYGIPPELGLLETIRAHRYRPPFVPARLRETATAELTGAPWPPQRAEDLGELDPVAEAERDAAARPRLSASEVLAVLHRRLDEAGVAPGAYRIGTTAEDAWCLLRTPHGWEVARHAGGRAWDRTVFATPSSAAAHLLGVLTLHPGRTLAEPDPGEAASDWPVAPFEGEPPMRLFRSRRMITLPAGTELVRFGPETGNLVHARDVRFAETSLPQDREAHRHTLRTLRPLRVLAAVTLPWAGMPGGAPARFLPASVAAHLETGALGRVERAAH